MSTILVLGGGVIGLSTGMMLARRGHDVTVLERDPQPVPGSPADAWDAWERRGVAQFRQPHYLHAAARHIFERHLPDVPGALQQADCVTFDPLTLMPPFIVDRASRQGDERFVTITGRRPTIEAAVAGTADRTLRVVRGVSIARLLTGSRAAMGIPHVTGVRAADGREFRADLVVDATGRASKLPDWLSAVGARRPLEEVEESGFIYYTRFFRSTTGTVPRFRAGIVTHFDSYSLLTLPGDAQTWSVTAFIFSGDPVLKALRDAAPWTSLVGACPLHAHWLDGAPVTDVLPMAGVANRYRRFVLDGVPVATGIVSVGDACVCTNPIGGRGISIGLMHAAGTAEVVREHLDDPLAMALAHDAMTEARITPWYRDTADYDRQRAAHVRAVIEGRAVPRRTDPAGALLVGMMHDPDLFRAAMEIAALLALPEEVMARPGLMDRLTEIARTHDPVVPPGPSRAALVGMLTSRRGGHAAGRSRRGAAGHVSGLSTSGTLAPPASV